MTPEVVGVIIAIVSAAVGLFGGLYLIMRHFRADFKEDFSALRTDFNEDLDKLDGKVDRLQADVGELKVDIAELKVGLSAVNEKIARLEGPQKQLQLG